MHLKVSIKILALALLPFMAGCGHETKENPTQQLAIRVRFETNRSWEAFKHFEQQKDPWFPVEAFSSLVVSGHTDAADEVVEYVADSLQPFEDQFIPVFELNYRLLGGLISMYQLTGDNRILVRAKDLGDRLLPAFVSPTGIPYSGINLLTGEVEGSRNKISDGSCLLEMGMLSYFTGDRSYYQAARRSVKAIFQRRSEIGLAGEVINVETGEWVKPISQTGAGATTFYEYLYKGWLLFGDAELKEMWDLSIEAILRYIPEKKDSLTWLKRVDMHTGERSSSVVTLSDASMPALLAISGHLDKAVELQKSWDWLWNREGIGPLEYDYNIDRIIDPSFSINPGIVESAWYLWELTGNHIYMDMIRGYFSDLTEYCDSHLALTGLKNVTTKEQLQFRPNYLLVETLIYFYLAFSSQDMYNLESVVFSTEAYPFLKAAMDPVKIRRNLNIREFPE